MMTFMWSVFLWKCVSFGVIVITLHLHKRHKNKQAAEGRL